MNAAKSRENETRSNHESISSQSGRYQMRFTKFHARSNAYASRSKEVTSVTVRVSSRLMGSMDKPSSLQILPMTNREIEFKTKLTQLIKEFDAVIGIEYGYYDEQSPYFLIKDPSVKPRFLSRIYLNECES